MPPSQMGHGARVVLLPGAGLGWRAFLPAGGPSLALSLAHRDFEVWIAALRGEGGVLKPGKRDASDAWTLDDEARLDLPALLRAASEGGKRLGLLAFGPAAASVALYLADAPVTLPAAVAFLAPWAWSAMPSRALLSEAPAHGGGWACPRDPASGNDDGPDLLWFGTPEVPRGRRTSLLRGACRTIPAGVLAHLRAILSARRLVHSNGEAVPLDGLASRTLPVWFGVGIRDNLAQPEDAEPFHEALAGAPRAWHVFSLSGGDGADYDHASLLWGDHAARDVAPALAEWFARTLREGGR